MIFSSFRGQEAVCGGPELGDHGARPRRVFRQVSSIGGHPFSAFFLYSTIYQYRVLVQMIHPSIDFYRVRYLSRMEGYKIKICVTFARIKMGRVRRDNTLYFPTLSARGATFVQAHSI
jgi:hypothetical protein